MQHINYNDEEKAVAESVVIYENMKDILTAEEIHFSFDDEKMNINYNFSDKSMVYHANIIIQKEMQRITWLVFYKFSVDINNDTYAKYLIALNRINNSMAYGKFSIDSSDGITEYEYSYPFMSCSVSSQLLLRMNKVIMYNSMRFGEKLFLISRGFLKPEEVLSNDNEK